ncbi:VOC family protein [Glycomyces rhizosphaerae]|uniref:VOC family protein n=1 Tax=Glycomyces rhizosphaerae TaxID=2054422 RepID=A0ABV7PW55_9ACTN
MIGKWHGLIINCPEPEALANFYQELLGMVRVQGHDESWIVIGDAADRPGVAFEKVEDYRPPTWPGNEVPQQMHFDVRVDDLDEAEPKVLALGARRLEGGGDAWRVFADPAGHPFCLVVI